MLEELAWTLVAVSLAALLGMAGWLLLGGHSRLEKVADRVSAIEKRMQLVGPFFDEIEEHAKSKSREAAKALLEKEGR